MKRIEFIRWSVFGGVLLALGPRAFSKTSYKVMRQISSSQTRHGMMNSNPAFRVLNRFQKRVEKTVFFADGVGPGQDDLINFDVDAFSKRTSLSIVGKGTWVNGEKINISLKDNMKESTKAVQTKFHSLEWIRLSPGNHTIQPNEETIIFSLSERMFHLNNETIEPDSFVILSRNKKFTIHVQQENQLIFINNNKNE